MYLNYLEENEKVAFLKLAHIVANIDGEVNENENIIIGSYCNEMNMEDIKLDITKASIQDISKEFKSLQSKKIITLELMSVINADGELKETETRFMNTLVKEFDLDEKFLEEVKSWSNSMLNIIEEGTMLITS